MMDESQARETLEPGSTSLPVGHSLQLPQHQGASTYQPMTTKPDILLPPPPTSILSKLQKFLPQIEAANAQLSGDIAAGAVKQVDVVEANDAADVGGTEGDSQQVQMNLMMGCWNSRSEADVACAVINDTQPDEALRQFESQGAESTSERQCAGIELLPDGGGEGMADE